jgi:hypothetical protein
VGDAEACAVDESLDAHEGEEDRDRVDQAVHGAILILAHAPVEVV